MPFTAFAIIVEVVVVVVVIAINAVVVAAVVVVLVVVVVVAAVDFNFKAKRWQVNPCDLFVLDFSEAGSEIIVSWSHFRSHYFRFSADKNILPKFGSQSPTEA